MCRRRSRQQIRRRRDKYFSGTAFRLLRKHIGKAGGNERMRAEQLDPNFRLEAPVGYRDIVWRDVRRAPFRLYGFCRPQSVSSFCRVPGEVAKATGEGVELFSQYSAGGRVRFRTDSPYLAVSANIMEPPFFPTINAACTTGFDLYMEYQGSQVFVGSFLPSEEDLKSGGFAACLEIGEGVYGAGPHNYTIDFPLYNGVRSLFVGLKQGSALAPGKKYRPIPPFVYYGSSITQGGCASRPGMCYQGHISRRFDIDYVNLGFSGAGRGEQAIADYMAGMDMSLFVCDYDYNAQSPEYLRATHFNLYRTIRRAKPEIPYLMISRPATLRRGADDAERRAVIEESYRNALAAGDKKVCYIDGRRLLQGIPCEDGTVDSIHPNDLGFWCMACVIGDEIAKFGF